MAGFLNMAKILTSVITKKYIPKINRNIENKKEWVDQGMTWDPSQYGNITTLPVAVNEYWTPGLI